MIIRCPECSNKVSSFAGNCMQCGMPVNKIKIEKKIENCYKCKGIGESQYGKCDCKNGKITFYNTSVK
ncbi:MAG: hypothetical protein ABF289_18125 [Clostridiales bacterium]